LLRATVGLDRTVGAQISGLAGEVWQGQRAHPHFRQGPEEPF